MQLHFSKLVWLHWLRGVADEDDVINEKNEGNNAAISQYQRSPINYLQLLIL